MVFLLTTLIGLNIAVSAEPTVPVSLDAWAPVAGDRLLVDTKENVGYIVHPNGETGSFPVLTGQRRIVHYIGRTYNAATPSQSWVVRSIDVKGRSMTFGETGTFMRLYDEDGETAYGIHSHLTFQKMLNEGDRYRSMGCILVSEEVLQILVHTTELNGGTLNVLTAYGVEVPEPAVDPLATAPSWLGF